MIIPRRCRLFFKEVQGAVRSFPASLVEPTKHNQSLNVPAMLGSHRVQDVFSFPRKLPHTKFVDSKNQRSRFVRHVPASIVSEHKPSVDLEILVHHDPVVYVFSRASLGSRRQHENEFAIISPPRERKVSPCGTVHNKAGGDGVSSPGNYHLVLVSHGQNIKFLSNAEQDSVVTSKYPPRSRRVLVFQRQSHPNLDGELRKPRVREILNR